MHYAHGSEARDTPKGISIQREPEAMVHMPGLMGGRKGGQGENRAIGIDKDGGNHLHLHGMHHHDHLHPMDNKDELDPQTKIFFMMEDFDKGNEMPVYFANRDLYASPPFLPKQMADSIPFSYKHLPLLLEMFSIPKNSPQAQAMRDTLTECESAPIRGETKMCATSFESMFDFVRAIFGTGSRFQILMTAHHQEQTPEVPRKPILQKYTILDEPQEIEAPTMVACHTMPYAYGVFYCHQQAGENKVFVVSLEGEDGDRVEAVAVCHMDTSAWPRTHVAFLVLGTEPGTNPACHFFAEDHLVLVPTLASV
ncbi:hypothetical protein ACLOJK_002831 [Asimina triloba]